MRTIKFRGKHATIADRWVYGDLLHMDGKVFIGYWQDDDDSPSGGGYITCEVDPATVGQFTGLHDKDGKEIWEGDVLRDVPKDNWEEINYSCFEVFFHSGDANADYNIGWTMSRMHHHGAMCAGYIPAFKPKVTSRMIVIGNIHDNPELLNK